jgi:hypothetical protein
VRPEAEPSVFFIDVFRGVVAGGNPTMKKVVERAIDRGSTITVVPS